MVITLSREAESGGDEIARLIAERAGIQLADRTILERIARRSGLPIAQLAVFDDLMPGPVEGIIAEWRTSVSHDLYLRRLVDALLALEREDNVLILGRGAAFVLTDPGTTHVRVVAPLPCRLARLIERSAAPRAAGGRLLARSDAARARFVRHAFDADINAACHYDLLVNTAELTLEDAAELILFTARRKAARRLIADELPKDLLSDVLRFRRRPRFPRVSEAVWRHCERRLSRFGP
jgi:cytidylate kinase